ncbi:hypothetical protein JW998_15350 [candidate division KSB1 bacterium]|nr:hypothetical protein [candidate division KSB1 bacterium]
MYRNLDYDNAIKILGDCLTNDKLDTTQQRLAHTYLAQAYHRKELKDPAKKIIKHLLDIDQSYRPDANRDRPSYIELFNEALAEWQSEVAAQQQAGQMSKIQAEPEPRKKNSAKKWLLIGAGAAAGVTVVAVLANRCDHDEKGSMNISW